MRQTGIPLVMSPWFGIVGETFVNVALEIAGATGVKVRRKPVEPSGERNGTPIVTMEADVQFETTSADASATKE